MGSNLVFQKSNAFLTIELLLQCCLHILTNRAHDQSVSSE